MGEILRGEVCSCEDILRLGQITSHQFEARSNHNLDTHRVRTTADSWHYEACEVIACKEFYRPDECRPDAVHLKCCFGCFQATMAERERALHVRDL
jgi:hypothetical protein